MPVSKRYLFAWTCLFVMVLSACTAEPESPEPSVPAGPVPTGLERFYSQSLDWGECEPYAESVIEKIVFRGKGLECSRVTVPLDYTDPEGITITIGVLRRQAEDTDERIGSLVMNPGGPGASGMVAAASMAGGFSAGPLGEHFDLVGFDPRGVGISEPQVQCLTGPERDADRADDTEVTGSLAEQEAEEREFAAKCEQRTEHGEQMLAHLGTQEVVQDLDVLRSVLGDEKLSYLGYSYGTRIGYTYAEHFPGNVRALLLDGALDPDQDAMEQLVGQAKGFSTAFTEFTKWCTQRSDCALGSDPSAATEEYQDLVRPLIDNPIETEDGRMLSYENATTGTIRALYTEQLWEQLNAGLNELRRGRGASLMRLADEYNERDPDGTYSSTQDAHVAIRCVDDPPVTDRDEIEEAQRRYYEEAPFRDPGTPPSAARDACAFWPVPNSGEPHLPDVEGIPTPLVISTTNDPATPYQAGVSLAKALDGRLLTFEGTQHTAFLNSGNECIDDAGTAYLIDGTLPPEGKRC